MPTPVQNLPAIANGKVYENCVGISSPEIPDTLHVFDKDSGAKLLGVNVTYLRTASVAAFDKIFTTTAFVSFGGEVFALNESDGSEVWNFDPGNLVLSSPAITTVDYTAREGILHVGCCDRNDASILTPDSPGKFYALDANTGAKLAELQTDGSVRSSPAVVYVQRQDGGQYRWVYVTSRANGGTLYAFKTVSPFSYDAGLPLTATNSGDTIHISLDRELMVEISMGGHWG